LFRKFHPESVGLAFGRESNQRLVRIALFEVPHLPRVWREESLFEDASELRLAAAFELDEVLHFLVGAELRRLIPAGGRPCALLRQRAPRAERVLAIHLQIDRDERECRREVLECEKGRANREREEENPERWLSEHGGF